MQANNVLQKKVKRYQFACDSLMHCTWSCWAESHFKNPGTEVVELQSVEPSVGIPIPLLHMKCGNVYEGQIPVVKVTFLFRGWLSSMHGYDEHHIAFDNEYFKYRRKCQGWQVSACRRSTCAAAMCTQHLKSEIWCHDWCWQTCQLWPETKARNITIDYPLITWYFSMFVMCAVSVWSLTCWLL